MLQLFVRADRAQHLDTIEPRHLDVEQHDGRNHGGPVGPGAALKQTVERLDAILDMDDRVCELRLAQRVNRHLGVGRAVFDQQDRANFLHHERPLQNWFCVRGSEKKNVAP